MALDIRLPADRKTAEVRLGGAVARLSAPQIDALIAALAGTRAQMKPPVPETYPQGQPTHRHDATRYLFGIDAETACPSLSLRSPGFGWLTFPLSFEEAEKLGALMQSAKDHPLLPSMRTRN